MKLNVTKERVIKAAEENPQAESTLRSLFPEAFEDNRQYCRIGVIMSRKNHPGNVYALFKWNGEIRFLNVSNNKFWDTSDSNRNIKVSQLHDFKGETLTYSEFKKLIGANNINDFTIIG